VFEYILGMSALSEGGVEKSSAEVLGIGSVTSSIVMHTGGSAKTGLMGGNGGGGTVAKTGEPGSINTLQAKRVANLLDRPSEALLLVLGQKYLAQLKKQARALHDVMENIYMHIFIYVPFAFFSFSFPNFFKFFFLIFFLFLTFNSNNNNNNNHK
jgi:hypothetical protein